MRRLTNGCGNAAIMTRPSRKVNGVRYSREAGSAHVSSSVLTITKFLGPRHCPGFQTMASAQRGPASITARTPASVWERAGLTWAVTFFGPQPCRACTGRRGSWLMMRRVQMPSGAGRGPGAPAAPGPGPQPWQVPGLPRPGRGQRSSVRVILCDTGPLVAAFNQADSDHARCTEFLAANWSRLVVPSCRYRDLPPAR